jgi:hypothetical protein
MEVLTTIFKIDILLYYLPLLLDSSVIANFEKLPSFEKNGFYFIGNFLHEPNWNAVQYLKNRLAFD